jgi:formylglycine-generating enzyme required for sulfatase activity
VLRYAYTAAGRFEKATPDRPVVAKLEMAWIPPGSLGVPSGAADDNPRDVKISGFWMSRCEVSADLFYDWYIAYERAGWNDTEESRDKDLAALAGPPQLHAPPEFTKNGYAPSGTAATGLTQYGAEQFCRWLSLRTGRLYRLPTEAEWEYAARAGTTTPWHFGDDVKALGEYAVVGEKEAKTLPVVARRRPNQWGLFDMYGNVGEWVLDGWSDDPHAAWLKAPRDPWVPRSKTQRDGVVRGGNWTSPPQDARSDSRTRRDDTTGVTWQNGWQWFDLSDDGRRIGFRVVSPAKAEMVGRESYLVPVPDEVAEGKVSAERRKAEQ